jgi:hypothetical protein
VGKIVGRRQGFAARHFPFIVDGNQIGKRSAYINCDSHEDLRFSLETVTIKPSEPSIHKACV